MEKWEKSEKYHKYLIEIILNGFCYYTVWGTDLNDTDSDKLLVNDNKLILFYEIIVLKKQISSYKHIFLDKQNFENWIIEESFQEPYSSTNLSCLAAFSENDLKHKSIALEIIDSLNIIQDFYSQIKKSEKTFSSKLMLDFKDNLYRNHFWKNDKLELPLNTERIIEIKNVLRKIYDNFVSNCQFI